MADKTSSLKDAWETMMELPKEQRLDYFWTYFKWPLLIAAFAVMLVTGILMTALQEKQQVLYGGIAINLTLTDKAQQTLCEDLFVHFGGTDKEKQTVELSAGYIAGDEGTVDYTMNYAQITSIVARMAAQELDYILMDTVAKNYFMQQDSFADLRDLLTTAQMEALSERVIWWEPAQEGKESYPFMLDLTGLPFAAECGEGDVKVYIGFPGNTERAEMTDEFVDWLMNFSAE